MNRTTTDLLRLPKIIEQKEVDTNLFPGVKSHTLGGPNSMMKPRKRVRQVTNISEDKYPVTKVVEKIRKLVDADEERTRVAARDYRLSEIKKIIAAVIPQLYQQSKPGSEGELTKNEKALLAGLTQIGAQLVKNSNVLRRINPQLSESISSIGKVLQGLDF